MEYKLVKFKDDYWLLDNQMSKNIGEFFMERLASGNMDVFQVDSENDLVHDGFKILGSTLTLPNIPTIDKEAINSMVLLEKNYTNEDIRAAMLFMAKTLRFIEKGLIGTVLETIDIYSHAIQSEWMCTIQEKEVGAVINGGLVAMGVIGGKGLQHHPIFTPAIINNKITITKIR